MSCEFTRLDASYVLGSLPATERAQFERHLPGCAACSQAVAELTPLPPLLAGVGAPAAERIDAGPPPDTLLPALVHQVRRSVRRRTLTTAAAAGLVGAALAGGALTVVRPSPATPVVAASAAVTATATPAPSRAPVRTLTAVGAGPLSADVAMTAVLWGTRLDLTCTYTPAGPSLTEDADEMYVLVVRTRGGVIQQVGSWHPLPGRTMRLAAATAMRADDIAAVEVREQDGVVIATLSG